MQLSAYIGPHRLPWSCRPPFVIWPFSLVCPTVRPSLIRTPWRGLVLLSHLPPLYLAVAPFFLAVSLLLFAVLLHGLLLFVLGKYILVSHTERPAVFFLHPLFALLPFA